MVSFTASHKNQLTPPMMIKIKLKLLWVDIQRRWIRVPYKLRSIIERIPLNFLVPKEPTHYDVDYINARVNYYNKMDAAFSVQNPTPFWQQKFKRRDYYVCDLFHLLLGIKNGKRARFDYLFGDITTVPPHPTILKSRPISGDNQHSILLKICRLRHFRFIRDPFSYEQKKDLAVWRGSIKTNAIRQQLVAQYHDHPRCNVSGAPSRKGVKYMFSKNDYMEISGQLEYKFIISLEGVDVATNLKWIMSSNSLCFAQKLKYETWFMEGTLIPNFHYILLADDFSDLEEKIDYYLAHPNEARAIIANANEYVAHFLDEKREDYIGRRVLLKYFEKSGQQAR